MHRALNDQAPQHTATKRLSIAVAETQADSFAAYCLLHTNAHGADNTFQVRLKILSITFIPFYGRSTLRDQVSSMIDMSIDAYYETRLPSVLSATIIPIVFATIFVGLRYVARRLSAADFWWDDWLLIPAIVRVYM